MLAWIIKENEKYFIKHRDNKVEITENDVIRICGKIPNDSEFPVQGKL